MAVKNMAASVLSRLKNHARSLDFCSFFESEMKDYPDTIWMLIEKVYFTELKRGNT